MGYVTKLSTKGQLVLPKSVRTAHGWKPGTEFTVQETATGVLLLPKPGTGTRTWKSIVGCVPYRGPRKSIREMDEGVAREARRHK